MHTISDSEVDLQQLSGEVLEALPALRRWLQQPIAAREGASHHLGPPPVSQVRVLIHLHQNGAQTMGKLARGLGISCSTATEGVAGLVALGRVTRSRSTTDSRQVIVSLTPEAEAIASQVLSRRQEMVENVLLHLDPEERLAFVKGIVLLSLQAEHILQREKATSTNPTNVLKGRVHA